MANSAAACNLCGAGPASQRSRWVRDGFEVVECGRCGLIFRRDLPGRDEVLEAYSRGYWERPSGDTGGQGYADYLGDAAIHRLNARRRLARLERRAAPGYLLDVGCAAGHFLDEARRRGWRPHGVELAAPMAEHARAELGLPVDTGFFQDASLDAGAYDCVTMWDYIEHSLDPVGDLARAREALRPGGLIAISTGDAGSLVARLSGRRWHLLTPRHHNFFFTRATLTAALARTGFQAVAVSRPAAWYTVGYAAHKLRTMMPRSRVVQALARRAGSSRAGAVAVPLNLWDIVTVLARAR